MLAFRSNGPLKPALVNLPVEHRCPWPSRARGEFKSNRRRRRILITDSPLKLNRCESVGLHRRLCELNPRC